MVTFITSSFVAYQEMDKYVPKPLDESYSFGANLRKYWKKKTVFLHFTSSPDNDIVNDHVARKLKDSFSLSGFNIDEFICFDYRYIDNYARRTGCEGKDAPNLALLEAINKCDILYLAGGHAPTQNRFMKECGLKEIIEDGLCENKVIIALSAGSVNSAREVYLIPELVGESRISFERFTSGLGLTDIQIIPHSDYEKTVTLDGRKLVNDIIANDSYGKRFYLISDGSYFMIRNGITEFFGRGEIIEDGVISPLRSVLIQSDFARMKDASYGALFENASVLNSVTDNFYDYVCILDEVTTKIEFIQGSHLLPDNGIYPVNIDTFDELNTLFSKKLVVKDEKEVARISLKIGTVAEEIEEKGTFVRTIHIDDGEGVRAENIRINRIPGVKRKLLVTLSDISNILDHDWMTDEYSRSGFMAKAKNVIDDAGDEPISVVYTNVKGFKAINDLLGSFCGDMIIFAEREYLTRYLQPLLLARLESDHFVMIVRDEVLAEENLQDLCYQVYEEESKRLPYLIRLGIYPIKDKNKRIQNMIDQAKLAEKSLAESSVVPYAYCNDKLSRDYRNKQILVSELDKALAGDEFKTYYQPIVDAKTGKIVSAEALIRWKHVKKGLISPGMFVPVFEEEGLISKLDSFMVDRVLRFNMKRQRRGKKVVPCAVNLSRIDFFDVSILNLIKKKIRRQENCREMIKLEVTESAYAVLEGDAITFLEEMRSLGLSILLDDFGSGMSSLSTLGSFDFDTIKLDMEFISKIGWSKKAEAIIKNTIALSHDIGAKVVAEGVETKEQLKFLKKSGCDMIQGYYFYKPMPEEEFTEILDKED